MSFSLQVKQQITEQLSRQKKPLAALYGALLCAGVCSSEQLILRTKSQAAYDFLHEALFVRCGLPLPKKAPSGGLFSLRLAREDLERLRILLPQSFASSLSRRIDWEWLERQDGARLFLQGAFLACGTVLEPGGGYHAEFACPQLLLSRDLLSLLRKQQLQPKTGKRRSSHLLYFKESEEIEDLLNILGATGAALSLMEQKVMNEVRGAINRAVNCETANIGKTVLAARAQLAAIERIEKSRGLESLPSQLRDIAALRRADPDLPLSELGAKLSPPLSRSGVNHRLQKLIQLAKEIENG